MRNIFEPFGLALVALAAAAGAANADFTVSARPTKHVTCSSGNCSTSGTNANLNVTELESMLAALDVKLVSNAKTANIVILVQLHWASANTLTLDANRSVEIDARVSVEGTAPGLTIVTSDGGTGGKLHVADNGRITFIDLNSHLTIDGAAYTLVADIPTLSADIHQNAAGNFALAENYDSSIHGTYTQTPVTDIFQGHFEGLGNTISNLEIAWDSERFTPAALFNEVDGVVRDIKLQNVTVINNARGPGTSLYAGLAATNRGLIQNSFVAGSITDNVAHGGRQLGGLVSQNFGTVDHCHTVVTINGYLNASVGGIVADNNGTISNSSAAISAKLTRQSNNSSIAGGIAATNNGTISGSYATGTIDGNADDHGLGATTGGIAGISGGPILQSYSTAKVLDAGSGVHARIGGLVGLNGALIAESYSTGQVVWPANDRYAGGLIGNDVNTSEPITNAYWDFDTSGISNPHQGAGQPLDDPGITGLTDAQLKSALPAGFDPNVWSQNPNINSGWPYLIANPPPQ